MTEPNEYQRTPMEEQMQAMIDACLARGFLPPMTWCVVGYDGAVFVGRLAPGDDTEDMEMVVLFEHYPQGAIPLPAQVLIADASGKAVRMVLQLAAWQFGERN
jgi:hypothetical protein